ncbi:MAG: type IX secretion system membrane protein PorP/SprF [Flavobacteriales bacterium]|nr:type IX secretion system membrane protein PorP/SprF [Flavobacteriales bacterium]
MKWLTLGLVLLAFAFEGSAQQLGRRTQFLTNTYLTNPAVAGTKNFTPIIASYRNQWAGFENAPVTYTLSGHSQLPNKIGIGAIFFRDDTGGAITNTGLELTGSYHVDLNNEDAVSFGLSGVIGQYSFDNESLVLLETNDPSIINSRESQMGFDANFGMMVYGANYFFGASVPQLIQTGYNIEGVLEDRNERVRHYNFMGSYLYYLDEDFAIQPSALVKFTASSPVQFDFYMRGLYKDFLWASLGYRHRDAVTLGAGFEYNSFLFSYAYDITVTDANAFSPHTHELTVGYYIFGKGAIFTEKSLLGPRRLGRGRLVK